MVFAGHSLKNKTTQLWFRQLQGSTGMPKIQIFKSREFMPFGIKPHVHLLIFSKFFDTCSFLDISQDTF